MSGSFRTWGFITIQAWRLSSGEDQIDLKLCNAPDLIVFWTVDLCDYRFRSLIIHVYNVVNAWGDARMGRVADERTG
ncbi:hypothetical protein RHIZ404_230211 [Rhizobium sp. EC-SD404]|nr:hypothetical protein RHIZ404_230211 [Rhizobium sp. EC-SD404]